MPIPTWEMINRGTFEELGKYLKDVNEAIVDNDKILDSIDHVRNHLNGLDDEQILARLKGVPVEKIQDLLKCKSIGERKRILRNLAGDVRVDTLEHRMKLRMLKFKIKIRLDRKEWEEVKHRVRNIRTKGMTVKGIWKTLALGVAIREFWELAHTDFSALQHLPIIKNIFPPKKKKKNGGRRQ
jgi:hypothetical protein